jgi:ribosome biogenesis GTPase
MSDSNLPLERLGWDAGWEETFAPYQAQGWFPARVVAQDKYRYLLLSSSGELEGRLLGRFLRRGHSEAELPKVGDWVACRLTGQTGEPVVIQAVLPRRTRLARKVPGRQAEEQVLVANVDLAFLVQALDSTFSCRLLERMLLMTLEGGIEPVVVLNKADLCTDSARYLAEVHRRVGETPVVVTSARSGEGLAQMRHFLAPGKTVVFIGPSGVGKSSLINQLYGEEIQPTAEVRERDHKGRHTTTWREMILLPDGALVIDTPGMREFHLWMAGEGLREAFPDIELLALRCRFRDCRHETEPGCAVRGAVDSGQLDPDRLASYQKLRNELEYLHRVCHWQRPPRRKDRPSWRAGSRLMEEETGPEEV